MAAPSRPVTRDQAVVVHVRTATRASCEADTNAVGWVRRSWRPAGHLAIRRSRPRSPPVCRTPIAYQGRSCGAVAGQW